MEMLKELFLAGLSVSGAVGITAAGMMLIRLAVRKWLPGAPHIAPGAMCLCWLLLAIRLLIPLELPGHLFSIQIPGKTEVLHPQNTLITGAVYQTDELPESQPVLPVDWIKWAALLWFAVAVLILFSQMLSYAVLRSRLTRWSLCPTQDIVSLAEELGGRSAKRCSIQISSQVQSPLLVGVIRPVIFLPPGLSERQIKTALSHELEHLKRCDIPMRIIIFLANAVHWFNPLVWLIAREADSDMESACDSAVLARATLAQRREYGEILLSMMVGRRMPFATAFICRKEIIMKRFANIMDTNTRRGGVLPAVLVLCASVLIGGLVGCSDADVPSADTEPAVSVSDAALVGSEKAEVQERIEQLETEQEELEKLIEQLDAELEELEKLKQLCDAEYGSVMDADAAMTIINRYRTEKGVPELITSDAALQKVSELRLEEIMESFSHKRPDGTGFESAYDQLGIEYVYCLENCGMGQQTAGDIVGAWISSPNHCANLLTEKVTHMCVAVGQDEEGNIYWIFSACLPE